jgi:hypothetical protein
MNEHHRAVVEAVGNKTLGLAGHAAFESFFILTRLPPPAPRYLSDHAAAELLARLGTLGVAGRAVYDRSGRRRSSRAWTDASDASPALPRTPIAVSTSNSCSSISERQNPF